MVMENCGVSGGQRSTRPLIYTCMTLHVVTTCTCNNNNYYYYYLLLLLGIIIIMYCIQTAVQDTLNEAEGSPAVFHQGVDEPLEDDNMNNHEPHIPPQNTQGTVDVHRPHRASTLFLK